MTNFAHPHVVTYKSPGLASFGIETPGNIHRTAFARHNDVGLNYFESGHGQLLLSTGYRYVLEAGRLAVFWAAVPHKVEAFEPGSVLNWLTVPLGTFLQWPMSKDFIAQLMRGEVFIEPDEEQGPHDLVLLKCWHKGITGGGAEERAIVLLEIEARIRRIAQSCMGTRHGALITPQGPSSQVERMLLLIAEHFREPLGMADVAAAVGLHPAYAGRLFHRHMGMRLIDYITECRLSHAKALLAVGEIKITDVAIDSGFGSVSRFHAIFKRLCGCTPRSYRMSIQARAS